MAVLNGVSECLPEQIYVWLEDLHDEFLYVIARSRRATKPRSVPHCVGDRFATRYARARNDAMRLRNIYRALGKEGPDCQNACAFQVNPAIIRRGAIGEVAAG